MCASPIALAGIPESNSPPGRPRHTYPKPAAATAASQAEAPSQPDAAEAERRVRAENRALLMEVWKPSIDIARALSLGAACGAVDRSMVAVILKAEENRMFMPRARLGFFGESDPMPGPLLRAAAIEGTTAADKGGCALLTPAHRARLRLYVEEMLR